MKEIEALPLGDRAEVINFAYRLDAERSLTGRNYRILPDAQWRPKTRLTPPCCVPS